MPVCAELWNLYVAHVGITLNLQNRIPPKTCKRGPGETAYGYAREYVITQYKAVDNNKCAHSYSSWHLGSLAFTQG